MIAAVARLAACLLLAVISCVDAPARGLEASASSVVLIVADLGDGSTRYGAGIVVDGSGGVVTSLHLFAGARSVRAMLYRPGRESYTPMDGGLARFLSENRDALVYTELVRSEPGLDMAFIRLHADTSQIPKLAVAREPPRVGERVFALGHPNESVWSLTAGVISSVRGGLIQHDAALGTGSSGGPLLDGGGRVLGINTAKLFEPAEGIGFARSTDWLIRFSGQAR